MRHHFGAVNPTTASGGTPSRPKGFIHRRRRGSQAFTLVELMIVVGIIVTLSTLAIPNYQRARSAALMGSVVSELMGFAKSCALLNATGVGETPSLPPVTADRGGVQITEGCTGENGGATLQASWGAARATGIICLDSRSQISSSKATLTITPGNRLSCSFQD